MIQTETVPPERNRTLVLFHLLNQPGVAFLLASTSGTFNNDRCGQRNMKLLGYCLVVFIFNMDI